eukprot:6202898-Pleurochrysis_carterae.AAC.1
MEAQRLAYKQKERGGDGGVFQDTPSHECCRARGSNGLARRDAGDDLISPRTPLPQTFVPLNRTRPPHTLVARRYFARALNAPAFGMTCHENRGRLLSFPAIMADS